MKITVVIPVYNVGEYIVRCIDSVKQQSYQGDIECILVDDCGKDDSIAKAERCIVDGPSNITFTIMHHEHNRGLSAARNTGTETATGDYVYYLDSDDTMTTDALELMVREVEKHPGVEIVQGTTRSLPTDDDYYAIKQYAGIGYIDDNLWVRGEHYKINGGLPVNAWNKLVNIDFIRRHNLYFREGIIHEDQQWMFYVVKHLSRIAFVQEPTYIHYRNSESIMLSSSRMKSLQHWGKILMEVTENIDEVMVDKQLAKYLCFFISRYGRGDGMEDYEVIYSRFVSLLKEHNHHVGATMCKLWHWSNNVLFRVCFRQYCKRFLSK